MADRKSWAFTLDGHIFYVLGTYQGLTLLCDLTTGQWCLWKTAGFDFWNMHRGVMWRGRVLAADDALPIVWELDPAATGDAETDEESTSIERVVTGFLPSRNRGSNRIGAARLTASVGDPDGPDVPVSLRYSDDEGETWSQAREIVLRSADYEQELKFRSLGRLREPGRLWEISDAGGVVRIDGLDADIDGEEQEMPRSPGT